MKNVIAWSVTCYDPLSAADAVYAYQHQRYGETCPTPILCSSLHAAFAFLREYGAVEHARWHRSGRHLWCEPYGQFGAVAHVCPEPVQR